MDIVFHSPGRSPTKEEVRMINRITDDAALAAGRWRWRKATSITSLADLQADRLALQGDQVARSHARSAHVAADPRWGQMYEALVALGRAGLVIDAWRPGTAAHGHEYGVVMETRAAVSGFASTEVKDWLDNVLYIAGYKTFGDDADVDFNVIELWAPGCVEYDRYDGDDSARFRGQPVERMDGVPTSWIGGSVNARELHRAFPTRRSVQRELREAWLVTIADREWGDSTLFADLLGLLSDKNHQVA
jgi:hypothetical protein